MGEIWTDRGPGGVLGGWGMGEEVVIVVVILR